MKWLHVLFCIYLLTNCCQADDIQLLLKLKSDPCGKGEAYLKPNSTNGESTTNTSGVVQLDPGLDFLFVLNQNSDIDDCDGIFQRTQSSAPHTQSYLQSIGAGNFNQQLVTLAEIEDSYRSSNKSLSRFAYVMSADCQGFIRNFSSEYSKAPSLQGIDYQCLSASYFKFISCLPTYFNGSRTGVPRLIVYVTGTPSLSAQFYKIYSPGFQSTFGDLMDIRVLVLEARPRSAAEYNASAAHFNEVATDPVYNIKFIGSVHDSLQDIMSIIKSEIDKL